MITEVPRRKERAILYTTLRANLKENTSGLNVHNENHLRADRTNAQ